MSNIIRDNEIRALERMNATLMIAKTVFPADKEITSLWFGLVDGMKTVISQQEKRVDSIEEL